MIGLALRNIKNSFRAYRSIYVMLLISQLIAVVILFFIYGIVASYDIKKEEKRIRETNIYATFEEDVSIYSLKDILPYIFSQMEERMEYCFIFIENPYSDLEATCVMEYHSGRYSVPSKPFSEDRLISGRYIDEEEMNNGSKVAFAYSENIIGETGNIYKVGDKCTFYGEEYEIVGIIDAEFNRITIPFTSCTKDMKTDWLGLCFYEFPTMSDYNIFKDTMTENYGKNVIISDFEPVELDDIIAYNSIIILGLAIGIVAALNTILVYNYLMKKRRKQMAVFGIIGANRMQQIAICEIEILIITLFTTLLGIAIFKFAIEDVVLDVYEIGMEIFNPTIYAIMIGAYIGCIMLGTVLMVVINTGKKALDVRRG